MPELSDVVKRLFGEYTGLKAVRREFERDPSPNNTQAREHVIGEDGQPAYSASAGLADTILTDRQRTNYENLAGFVNKDNYQEFKSEFYGAMSDQGQASAYASLLFEHDDIRARLAHGAVKRVAVKHKLEARLSSADPNFAGLTEDQKLAAYEKAIKADKDMKKELGEDAGIQVLNALSIARTVLDYVNQGKIDDAVNAINGALGVNLGMLYRNEGQAHNAKLVAERVAGKQLEYAARLMAENGFIAGDVEAALDKVEFGYAKAASEVYAAYNSDGEKGFRSQYQKARTAGEAANLADFKKKLKEKEAKKLWKEAA